jgi:hypothetical protein
LPALSCVQHNEALTGEVRAELAKATQLQREYEEKKANKTSQSHGDQSAMTDDEPQWARPVENKQGLLIFNKPRDKKVRAGVGSEPWSWV